MHHRIHDIRDMYNLDTEEDVSKFLNDKAERLHRRGYKLENQGSLQAYINDGRWVASCSRCNSGIACSPGRNENMCLECGSMYEIIFPSNWRAVENVLLERKMQNRNWHFGETVAELKAENDKHGVQKPTAL